MARRTDNECAWCAEVIIPERELIGADWKIYCSENCRKCGEQVSRSQWQLIMSHAIPSRHLPIGDTES